MPPLHASARLPFLQHGLYTSTSEKKTHSGKVIKFVQTYSSAISRQIVSFKELVCGL